METSDEGSLGRPVQPPYKKTKGKLLSDGPPSSSADSVYDSDYLDDDIFYTAGSQGDNTCGDPFAPSDHFFDTTKYHKNGNTPVLPSPRYWLSLSGQTYYPLMKIITNIPNSCLIRSFDSRNRRNIATMKRKIAYSSNTVTITNIALN